MSAQLLPSARPVWAVTAWVDNGAVFIEIPAKTGAPYIQKFELCDGGLGKALKLMQTLHKAEQPQGGYYQITQQANITKKPEASAAQRDRARAVLRKMGIVG